MCFHAGEEGGDDWVGGNAAVRNYDWGAGGGGGGQRGDEERAGPGSGGGESGQGAPEHSVSALRIQELNPLERGAGWKTGVTVVNPLEQSDWEAQLPAESHVTPFHTAGWAQVLHETYGHRPMYLAMGGAGQFSAVLPLMEVASPFTGRRGVSLPFTDACPVLETSPGMASALYPKAVELGRERGWRYLECRYRSPAWAGAAPSLSFCTHELALSSDEEAQHKLMASSKRTAIRKAEQSGSLRLEIGRDEAAIRAFYQLHCGTRQRHGVPPQPYRFFQNIARHMLAKDKGLVMTAFEGTRPVAAAVYLYFRRRAIYKFGASELAFQQLRPNDLVMWAAIRHFAARGFTSLDFGRSSLANEGLRRFKSGFGAREATLDYHRYDFRNGAFGKDTDRAESWMNQVFSRTPAPVLRWLGSRLYPHLS